VRHFEGVLKIDLHIHTADDPVDRIPHAATDLIERAAQLGFQALAITLHDAQYDARPLSAFAERRGITLIPGIERTILGRHVLLINFPPVAERVETFEDVAALRSAYPQGLVIAPHPFFPLTNCLRRWMDRYADLVDAVEYNGCYTSMLNFNRAAVEWARTRGKPMIGGSDTHRLQVFGLTYSLVDAVEQTAEAVCAAVKQGRVQTKSQPLSAAGLVNYLGRMVVGGRHPPTSQAALSRTL
jgi:predicted metal-dependent phosphoesterase TrpH